MTPPLPPRPAALGTPHQTTVGSTTLQWFEAGPEDGPVVVLVHGLLVNADLWRRVVPGLAAAGLRCIAVDWPLGSHRVPVPDQPLDPPAVADLVADFLDALDLRDVTLLGNDTGGAIIQILLTRRPERVGRVILTPCDCFEQFPPQPFTPLPRLVRLPGSIGLMARLFRLRALQRSRLAYGWLSKDNLPDEVVDSYLAPMQHDPAIRRDVVRFVGQIHRRHTLAAAEKLPGFDRPVLLAWTEDDRVFPLELAERLLAVLPQARLIRVPDSRTFMTEDQPGLLVELVVDFLAEQVPGIPSPHGPA